MGILDPIASDIGHGQMGPRSGLRLLTTLARESESQKHAYVEIRGQHPISSWSGPVSSVYSTVVDETFNGRRMDVVGVQDRTYQLTRVEALADVVAGTYFWDPDVVGPGTLYVRLSDSSVPAVDHEVYVAFGFYFSNVRVVQPTLGPDKLVDGAVEVWSSPTVLTNYSTFLVGAGTGSVNRDSSIVAEGAYSARLDADLTPGSDFVVFPAVNSTSVANARYRFGGLYFTPSSLPPALSAAISVRGSGGTTQIDADGRSYSASQIIIPLMPTSGEWCRFTFDFVAPDTAIGIRFRIACTGVSARGSVYFDGLKLQRIYRFEEYEPRLTYGSLPPISEGRHGMFFEQLFTGQGQLSLQNDTEYLEGVLNKYEFNEAETVVRVGGRFANDGNEIPIEDVFLRRWTCHRVLNVDSHATLDMDSPQQVFKTVLPLHFLSTASDANLATRDAGRPRPIVLADATDVGVRGVRMPRVDKTADGYGVYETLDPAYFTFSGGTLNDVAPQTAVAYQDDQTAAKYDPTKYVVVNTSSNLVSNGTRSGRVKIVNDIQVLHIEKGKNDLMDFSEGAGNLVATIAPGYYRPGPAGDAQTTLCDAIKTALQAAGAGTYTVTYNESTHKFTIAAAAGTLDLKLAAGAPNRDKSVWATIGFTSHTDKTGALSYAGDDSIFDDVDTKHILQYYPQGYIDDASGTFTGSAGGKICLPGDIYYFLLRVVLNVPLSQINVASIVAARAGLGSMDHMALMLGGAGAPSATFGELVEWVQNGSGMELLHDGDVFFVRKRDNSTPANVVTLYDRDILGEPEVWHDSADVYATTIVSGTPDEATNVAPQWSLTQPSAVARLRGLNRPITFRTCLPGAHLQNPTGNLASYLSALSINASTPRRRFRFFVKGACIKHVPGDKVIFARSVYMGRATDAATTVLLRIINIEHDLQSWVSHIEAAECLGSPAW